MGRLACLAAPLTLCVLALPQSIAGAAGQKFFSLFPGPHRAGSLLIDEKAGAVGGIHLGESAAAVVRTLGVDHRWNGAHGGGGLIYCAKITAADACLPPNLQVYSAVPMTIPGLSPKGHGVEAIELWGRPGNWLGQDAVTSGGVRIGTSTKRLRVLYRIVRTRQSCYSTVSSELLEYYAYAGNNTIIFSGRDGHVLRISVISGHTDNFCH
jgi:hypothetical protein